LLEVGYAKEIGFEKRYGANSPVRFTDCCSSCVAHVKRDEAAPMRAALLL